MYMAPRKISRKITPRGFTHTVYYVKHLYMIKVCFASLRCDWTLLCTLDITVARTHLYIDNARAVYLPFRQHRIFRIARCQAQGPCYSACNKLETIVRVSAISGRTGSYIIFYLSPFFVSPFSYNCVLTARRTATCHSPNWF